MVSAQGPVINYGEGMATKREGGGASHVLPVQKGQGDREKFKPS